MASPTAWVWLARVGSVSYTHLYLLERKPYIDMTGNNTNHPNDFLARLYVQTLLAALSL